MLLTAKRRSEMLPQLIIENSLLRSASDVEAPSATHPRPEHVNTRRMANIRGGSRTLATALRGLVAARPEAGAHAHRCPRGSLVAPIASVGRERIGEVRGFVRGSAPAWSASGPLIEQMQVKIRDGLGGAEEVEVIDVSGDARHVNIRVVSAAFEGKNAINRQRLVYKCIWEEMQSERVHAVQGIETKTPAEAAK